MPHTFASNPFDRVPLLRADERWLRAQREDKRGRYLLLRDLDVAVRAEERPELAWLDRTAAAPWAEHNDLVLLGTLEGVPHFAVSVEPEAGEVEGIEFREPRGVATELPPGEAGMLAQARSLVAWHASNRYCGRCGAQTHAVEGGARRHCDECGTQHYPQVSPSMIVLVERGDTCLLGRRARGAPNRYSCLAGYIEAGESIEDATIREVYEEAGVRVQNVRYHSSQPWPFPATLMIGCFAEAASDEIAVDGIEIEEARWVTRDDARRALAGEHPTLRVPDGVAIAHHLIKAWVEGE